MRRVAEFETKFPRYCRKCGGWGGRVYEPYDYDECPECLGAKIPKCPICGEAINEACLDEEYYLDDESYLRAFPCGHVDKQEGFPFCDCGIIPICEEDLVEMKYVETKTTRMQYNWEIDEDIFECPNCLKRKVG